MTVTAESGSPSGRLGRHAAGLALAGLTLLGTLALSSTGLGKGINPAVGPLSAAQSLLSSGLVALLYLGAGVGLAGPISRRLAGDSPNRWWVQLALGAGGIFWLSHLVGIAGGLSGAFGQYSAIAIAAAGLAMLLVQFAHELRQRPQLPAVPSSSLLGVIGLAVLFCAACSPPGVLWKSEAGGFDALSYHLPLAQEWAAGPRLWPLEHNVYSYLPSYYEAGLLHLSAALGGGTPAPGAPVGLLAYDGLGAVAAQLLAAFSTIITAALAGRVAAVILQRAGCDHRAASLGAGLTFAILVSVPWSVVCGSLAYNEMPAAAMFAGALLVAIDTQITPGRRWLLAGALTGLACAFKPTAMFIAGPTVGLLLLSAVPARSWVKLAALGVLGGVITFGPPLVRNAIASGGNPVFPVGVSLFGRGHWSQEQSGRFARAHRVEAPVSDRIAMLFSAAPDPSSVDVPPQPRGLMHRQWSMIPLAGLLAAAALMAWPATRAFGTSLLIGSAAAFIWWIGFSHAQSRFLLPLVVPWSAAVGALVGLAVARVQHTKVWVLVWPLAVTPLLAAGTTVFNFLIQNGHAPNALLGAGVGVITGEDLRARFAAMDPAQRDGELATHPHPATTNLLVPPGKTLYLFGDSTPFYYTGHVIYHTTWDTPPMAKAMVLYPDDPARWAAALAERGVEYILINFDELHRLNASGWYDPRVTPEMALRLAREQCEVVHRFTTPTAVLLRLTPTAPKKVDPGSST